MSGTAHRFRGSRPTYADASSKSVMFGGAAKKEVLRALSVSRLCGTGVVGKADGNFQNASFNSPTSMCTMPDGSIIVSDTRNSCLRRVFVRKNNVITLNTRGVLLNQRGICRWGDKKLLVCDTGHNRIRSFNLDTSEFELIAGCGRKGFKDSTCAEAKFDMPTGICVAHDDIILVVDRNNNRIRRISLSSGVVNTCAGSSLAGIRDGAASQSHFNVPTDIIIAADKSFLISDTGNNTIRRLTSDRTFVTTVAGGRGTSGLLDGSKEEVRFNSPEGMTIGPEHAVYIVDKGNNCIRRLSKDGGYVCTFAGSIRGKKGFANGRGDDALFYHPKGICVLPEGTIAVSDSANHLIRLLKIEERNEEQKTVRTAESRRSSKRPVDNDKFKYSRRGPHRESTVEPEPIKSMIEKEKPGLDIKKKTRRVRKRKPLSPRDPFTVYSAMKKGMEKAARAKHLSSADIEPNSPESLLLLYDEELHAVFRYYTYFVDPLSSSAEMTSQKFFKFVRDCKLVDSNFIAAESDIVFLKATQEVKESRLSFDGFKRAIILLARVKFLGQTAPTFNEEYRRLSSSLKSPISEFGSDSEEMSTTEAVNRLLIEHVFPLSEKRAGDVEGEELLSKDVFELWREHEPQILKIFLYYARYGRNVPPSSRIDLKSWQEVVEAGEVVDFEQLMRFARDFNIFPNLLSRAVLLEFFRRTAVGSDSGSYKFTIYEFVECLGRLAMNAYGSAPHDLLFPTCATRIEALLEHMHSSSGGTKFAKVPPEGLFPRVHHKFLQNSPLIERFVSRQNVLILSTASARRGRVLEPSLEEQETMDVETKLDNWRSRSRQDESDVTAVPHHGVESWVKRETVVSNMKDAQVANGRGKLFQFNFRSRAYAFLCNAVIGIHRTTRSDGKGYIFRLMVRDRRGSMSLVNTILSERSALRVTDRKVVQFCDGSSRIFTFHFLSDKVFRDFEVLLNTIFAEDSPDLKQEEHESPGADSHVSSISRLSPETAHHDDEHEPTGSPLQLSHLKDLPREPAERQRSAREDPKDEEKVEKVAVQEESEMEKATSSTHPHPLNIPSSTSRASGRVLRSYSLKAMLPSHVRGVQKDSPLARATATERYVSSPVGSDRMSVFSQASSWESTGSRRHAMTNMMYDDELTLLQQQNRSLVLERQDLEGEIDRLEASQMVVDDEKGQIEEMKSRVQQEKDDLILTRSKLESVLDEREEELHELQTFLPRYEALLLSFLEKYSNGLKTLLGCERPVAEELKSRLHWATSLFFAGRLDMFEKEVEDFDKYRYIRCLEGAIALTTLEPEFCERFATAKEYYAMIARMMPEDTLYCETFVHDGNGLSLFFNGEKFGVARGAPIVVTLNIFDRFFETPLSRDALVVKVFINGEEVEDVMKTYLEYRQMVSITIPLTVLSNEYELVENSTADDDEVHSVISKECSAKYSCTLPLRVLFKRESQSYVCEVKDPLELPLDVFEDQSHLDAVFAPTKAALEARAKGLCSYATPLALFSYRKIVPLLRVGDFENISE